MRPDRSPRVLRGGATAVFAPQAARFRVARGVAAGIVSAAGALVAHLLAGGSVELVPGLVVTAVAVPLAVWATPRHELGAVRLAALAVAAQVVGHLSLLMAPTGPHAPAGVEGGPHGGSVAHLVPSPSMFGAHAVVVVATIAVAGGADAAVLGILRAVAGWLLPRLRPAPAPPRYAPPVGAVVRRSRSRRGDPGARPRAPPFVAARAAYVAR